MRTSTTLLAAGIAAVLIGMVMVGPSAADQVVGLGSIALAPTTAHWSGSGGPPVLTVRYYGNYGGFRHGNGYWRGRYGGYFPYYSSPYRGYNYYRNNTCVWNGYSYTCYSPGYDVY